MAKWVEGRVVENRQWTERLFSLRFEADLAPFKAGQFVRVALDIDGERVTRPYSLVNAPHERPCEIYFNIVPEGPLSPRLAQLQAGDRLWVNQAASGLLTIDQVPECRDLWLLATGTAIGPFLSILKTDEPWTRFEHLVLGYSVRTASELSYRDTIDGFLAAHPKQFRFVPFVTREDAEGALRMRIPAAIAQGVLERRVDLTLSPESAHVMLCGNSGMIADVTAVLEQRGMRRHRRREPGHITTEKYH